MGGVGKIIVWSYEPIFLSDAISCLLSRYNICQRFSVYRTKVSTVADTNFAIELPLRSMVHNPNHTGNLGQMTRDCSLLYLISCKVDSVRYKFPTTYKE